MASTGYIEFTHRPWGWRVYVDDSGAVRQEPLHAEQVYKWPVETTYRVDGGPEQVAEIH